ncbi:MAG: hypothetical protein RLZZ385_1010 [Pseudomonadota bacterium]|jgi:rSAM/selenodomain-associated transferase 2
MDALPVREAVVVAPSPDTVSSLTPPRRISIIMPVLNEGQQLEARLRALQPLRQRGHEVIVVDGESRDGSLRVAEHLSDIAIIGRRGRARQMNLGASQASGDLLVFLHADTELPADADSVLPAALAASGRRWGRFDVRFSGRHWMLPVIATAMNWRSRLTGVATGDQVICIERELFREIGGYADIPLMEDIEICKRLRHQHRPCCLTARVLTSSRRWESAGVWRTMLLMWRLRLLYWLGVPPSLLVEHYYKNKL